MLESLVLLSLFRLGFIAWLWPRIAAVEGVWPVLGYGVRFDLLVLCYASALPVICCLLLPAHALIQHIYRRIEAVWFSLCFGILVYMETATPSYVNQYDTRPGRISYEYLSHPKEVMGTLWADYKLQLLLGVVLLLWALWFSWRSLSRINAELGAWRYRWRLLALPICALLVFLGARSSLDHRPANISTAAFSSDQLVNRLGVNSTYSLLYAISNIANEGRAERIYTKMPPEEMLRLVRRYVGLADEAFISTDIPTLHKQLPARQLTKPRNTLILLEESLGADFVGSLGGEPFR